MNLLNIALLLIAIIERCNASESVFYHAPEDKRDIINAAEEDLDVDNILKKSTKNTMFKSGDGDNSNEELQVEFKAFGENHKIKLRTHHDDPELASAFGDKYGVYSMKIDKKTGKKKFLKHADSLGDANSILDCIYKGERDDGALAVYIACQGIDHLIISNVNGNENEQIEVKKDKKSGKMKASKKRFSDLRHIDDGAKSQSPNGDNGVSNNNNHGIDRRKLAANECSLYPQKYVSMVVVNSVSRLNKFGSNAAVEADTVAQFLLGKVSYDRTTTPLGCNVKVRLAGQLFETSTNKIIREPFCNEVDTKLAAIQISHNANSGSNGCCSTFPINWNNCGAGETKCWNANAPNNPSGWTTAAPHPVPGVDFTTTGGCYNSQYYGTWYSGSKSVSYFGMGNPYLASNDPTQISHGAYLDYTSAYFRDNAATLRTTFGDVDNVQGWTDNSMHSGVAGLGWVGTQCTDSVSTSVVSSKWGVYVWLHELGHNLGMNHQTNGIMGRRLGAEKRRELIDFFAPESEADLENFLVNKYGVNGGARCMENNPPTRNPTPKPTLRPDFIPTQSPTAGNGGRCDPYICGGSTCGTGNSCWRNGICYDWTNGVGAGESCEVYACNPNLSCHPDTRVCTPCSGTASPTNSYIPGGGIGAKCNADQCGASTCDPKLTCDSDGICKKPGKVSVGGICRQDFCLQGLTCNRVSDTCVACPPTTSPTAGTTPTTQSPTTTSSPTTSKPTTGTPSTTKPTSQAPTTAKPTTQAPTTAQPTTPKPTITNAPTSTFAPTTSSPATKAPTVPTQSPTVVATPKPTTLTPTNKPTSTSICSTITRRSRCNNTAGCRWSSGACISTI